MTTELKNIINKMDQASSLMTMTHDNHTLKDMETITILFKTFEYDRKISPDDNKKVLNKLLRDNNFPSIDTLFKMKHIYVLLERIGSFGMITIKRYIK